MSNPPYLALDLGLRRTGVAISESGLVVAPLTTLTWEPPHAGKHLQDIIELIKKHDIMTVVVGLPVNEDGTPTGQSDRTEELLDQFEHALREAKVSVFLARFSEFHSTQDGKVAFPGVDKDAAAAAVLLQDYLESL